MANEQGGAVATMEEVGNFDSFMKQNSQNAPTVGKHELNRSLTTLRRTRFPNLSTEKLTQALEKRSEVQKELAEDYLKVLIQEVFPRINPELFEKKRYLVASVTDGEKGKVCKIVGDYFRGPPANLAEGLCVAEVPLLMNILVGETRRLTLGEVPYTAKDSYGTPRRYTISITIDNPRRPEAGLLLLKGKALAAYYAAISKMAANPNLTTYADSDERLTPSFSVAWIPSGKAMSVEATIIPENTDPALIMKVGKDHFLIGTWDIAEEIPLDSYLREYSEGNMKNVVRLASSKK